MRKIVFAGAAVVLLAAGCASQTGSSTSMNTTPPEQQTPTTQTTPPPTPTRAPAMANSDNASLNASLGNIDAQMNGLNGDNSSADSSLNAQTAP